MLKRSGIMITPTVIHNHQIPVQIISKPDLTTTFDPEKNPEDSQSQSYERRKKPEPKPLDDDEGPLPAAEAPGMTGGAVFRRHIPVHEGLAVTMDAMDINDPLPMLRRRSNAYERMMLFH
jgi:hypothetical protein